MLIIKIIIVKEKKNQNLNIYWKVRTRTSHVGGLVSQKCKISLKICQLTLLLGLHIEIELKSYKRERDEKEEEEETKVENEKHWSVEPSNWGEERSRRRQRGADL